MFMRFVMWLFNIKAPSSRPLVLKLNKRDIGSGVFMYETKE